MDLSKFRLATTAEDRIGIFSSQNTSLFSKFNNQSNYSQTKSTTDDAIEIGLTKRSKKSLASTRSDETLPSTAPQSGIRSLLSEVKSISTRIKKLTELSEKLAPGSERLTQVSIEIAKEGETLSNIFKSSTYKRLSETVNSVKQILSQGGNSALLARALQSDAALLGNDFIARVGNGEISNVELFATSLSSLEDTILGNTKKDSSFFAKVDTAVASALKALSGPSLENASQSSPLSSQSSLIAPLPKLKEISFNGAQELAIGIRGYIGADAIQASLAHIDYDPKQALVLLVDKPKDLEEKRREEQEEKKEDDDRFSAGIRTEGI